ncbi:diacylglycerol kinase family protein [Paenisporosarcina cavernae]|uniref:Diacylglycerol kinase family protein n=1 Tax=Paenisporosarcina cavernae TaxID=2320858 RepID=A0A385YVL4_9BACL|nr:diacylglycerol kinase family protein [Paenisporosarcina cavernae]AYC29612.1 diacylglycerol kinase family protein [Paenisporosarcina cavernae]
MWSKKFWHGFHYAFEGFIHAVKTERNFRFHLVSALIVLVVSWWLRISFFEWIIVILLITGVLVLELLNTVLERVVNLIMPTQHPLAKQAKDVSAAAVFVFALASAIIGLLIFLPKISTMIN